MTPIAPSLLNKIQAVKTLRDRAATDGEKDAAQHKLTILLAKHKLTEQDIPNPDFSTRGRYHSNYEPPPPPENPSPGAGGFDPRDFEDVLRRMRWEAQQAQRRSRQQQQARRGQARKWGNPFEDEPSRGRTSNPYTPPSNEPPNRKSGKLKSRERFEQALQTEVSNQAWRVAKNAHKRAARMDEPSNKAAYSRAFYEAAGIRLYERLTRINLYNTRSPKSKNPEGTAAGRVFGDTIDLKWFPIPPPPA